jgi:hypothetical protein
MGLRVWQAIVCLLVGFLLAATSAAPSISRLLAGLVRDLPVTKTHSSMEGR